MEITFNTRLSVLFVVGIVGLFWQAVIVSVGGEASKELIGAFSTILLATIGIGIKVEDGSKNDE
jgi:hypothetical protein